MGTNYLPRPTIEPQPAPDAGQQLSRVLQMKELLGQQQLQKQAIAEGQLELQDQQNMRKLAPQFIQKSDSGKVTGYDTEGYFNGLLSAGVNPVKVAAMRNQYAETSKNLAGAGTAQLELKQKQASQAYQLYEGVRSIAEDKNSNPDQIESAYQDAVTKAAGLGIDTSKMPQSYAQLGPQGLKEAELGLGVQSQMLSDAKEIAQTNEAGSRAAASAAEKAKTEVETQKSQVELDALKQMGGLSPQLLESKYIHLQTLKNQGIPLPEGDQAFMKAYEKQKTLVPVANFNLQNAGIASNGSQPSAIAKAVADGSMKWGDVVSARMPGSVKEALLKEVKQLNPNFNSGDFAIEQKVKEEFTSGDAAKNLTAFNTAIEHANQLSKAADALANGNYPLLNKLGNQAGYQFGSDKMTNFNVIKNALTGEISKVFKGGQATDAEIKAIQDPFSAANSPAQLKGAIDNAITLMNSKRDALKQQFEAGKNAQPNFGNSNNSQATHVPGGAAVGLQENATGTGSDGRKYIVKGGKWVPQQ